ncbi:MAG: response regulator [Hyphomicrobiaceae bacterium]|nr:response regulator [Hyphomicrobiaceae bacterium]
MSKTILVLDDNVDVAQGVADILEMCGYSVVQVHDGPSAVAAYLAGGIDMGLFDVRMPGMNGVEAFLEIKRQAPAAAVILMSGYADEDLVKLAIDNGALGLLSKPFEPEDMLNRIEDVSRKLAEAA